MKRFLVFLGEYYASNGGIDDLEDSFDTKEEAISFLEKYVKDNGYSGYEFWWYVFDLEKEEKVYGEISGFWKNDKKDEFGKYSYIDGPEKPIKQ